jgi:hypothetical protein
VTAFDKARPMLASVALGIGLVSVAMWIYGMPSWAAGVGAALLSTVALAVLFAGASLSTGTWLMRAAFPGPRVDGFWPLAFATGAAAFSLINGFGALVGVLGSAWFVLMPVAMIALGWRATVREWFSNHGTEPWAVRLSPLELIALVFGALCLALIALQPLNTDIVNYDAAWYHLRGAERYALAGRMMRMADGDMLLALPQTATWFYSWGFLWPTVTVNERVRLALFLELSTVLGTVALLPALVRALCPSLPRELTRLSWVAFFFFPSIFIYDTGVMGGADHVVALWATSAMLLFFLVRRARTLGAWALFGLHLAGLLAKYSSLYLLGPLALVVAVDWARTPRKLGPIVAACLALVLTSPYWLRNAVFYGNPVYPAANRIFHGTPWNDDAEAWQANYKESTHFSPSGTAASRLRETAQALVSWPTRLNTWGDMTGQQPIAGPAYLLSLLALPFLRDRRGRLILLAFIVHAGIAIWFNTHQHHMRYLTVLMGLMAAGTAAVAISLWRTRSLLARGALVAVVGWHVPAFADMPFRKTHRMAGGQSTVGLAAEFLASHARSPRLARWEGVGKSLPPSAVPLVHGTAPHLGLGRQSLTDVTGLQFGINYGRWGGERAVLEQLRKMGATHLVWGWSSEQSDSVTGEATFLGLASQVVEKQVVGGLNVGELPQEARDIGEGILYLGCNHLFENGLYTRAALTVPVPPWYHPFPHPEPVAKVEGDWHALLSRASYVAIESACQLGDPPTAEFTYMNQQVGFPSSLNHWVRTAGQAQSW